MVENLNYSLITTVLNRGDEREIFGAIVVETKQDQPIDFIAEDLANVLFMAEVSHKGKIVYIQDNSRLSKIKADVSSEYLVCLSISRCSDYEEKKRVSGIQSKIGKTLPSYMPNLKGHEITSVTQF
ncbi:hypothetical protein [Providencia sp. PROV089]|uniref:hypothetical protein n=1 Tax=Providencia sp. PROV089 TaxID=2949805 RepID=UPI00234A3FE5|nr:hypothetical protein [Providencia sp. PROV089]